MVLTVAGIVVKILGGANRILLSRLLEGEGIGLYQMAYPLYILFLSIAGAGIPIAVSIMVAEQTAKGNYSGAKRIFHITLAVMTLAALGCGIAMALGAKALIAYGLVRDDRAYLPLLVLAPALTISIVTCCFRGYFQGLQLMTPTAVSQMVDQFVRVCTMLALAWLLFPYGLEIAAAGATFGAVPGAAAGLAVIAFLYYRHSRAPLPADEGQFAPCRAVSVIRRLAVLAVPVAAANMLLPAVASIDLFIVPQRLEAAGYTIQAAGGGRIYDTRGDDAVWLSYRYGQRPRPAADDTDDFLGDEPGAGRVGSLFKGADRFGSAAGPYGHAHCQCHHGAELLRPGRIGRADFADALRDA